MDTTRPRCGALWTAGPTLGLTLVFCGCSAETATSPRDEEGLAAAEPVGEGRQPITTPTCVTLKRGLLGDVHDAMLSGDHPTWKAGGDFGMWTGRSSGGNENRSLVRFDLDFLPPFAIVTSATLHVFVDWSMYSTTVRAHEVHVAWDEQTVSAASFPANGYSPVAIGSYQTPAAGSGYRTVDLTALAGAWVSGSKDNHGILLEEDPVRSHYHFTGEGSASRRPRLELCYLQGAGSRRAGALMSGGRPADSESYRFLGGMGEGPGANRTSSSKGFKLVWGFVGATQP